MKKEIRLTKKENEIIYLVQNGYVFITGNDFGAFISMGYDNRKIRMDVWRSLLVKNLIFQNCNNHYQFDLTEKGKHIKTTPVKFPPWATFISIKEYTDYKNNQIDKP